MAPPKGTRPPNYRHGHGTCIGQGTKGGKSSPEYVSWSSMKARCKNPRHKDYHRYGGRNLTFCDRWLSFDAFLSDMGCKPSSSYQLERIDNDQGYSPENCCWATPMTQANNRKGNVCFSYQGKTQTLSQWARESGLNVGTLWTRIRIIGMPFEQAISQPLREQ